MFAHDAAVEKGPMYVLLLVCSVIEICTGVPKVFQLLNDPDAVPPGDFKFDPLGFGGGKELEARAAAFSLLFPPPTVDADRARSRTRRAVAHSGGRAVPAQEK